MKKENEIKTRKIEQINANKFNNYFNYSEEEEDLDIELNSISKKIPINNFINIDQISNKQNENKYINKKPKIKRSTSINSFFDDIQYDNTQNNIIDKNYNDYIYTNTNTNLYTDNYPKYSELNTINFGLTNKPEIQSNPLIGKDNIHTITDNTKITNNANNNINIFNDNKNSFPIRRHNSDNPPNLNKFLDINKETTFLTNENINYTNNINNNNNNQLLYDEIQKLKKENRRLLLKNNELSLKIKTKETKTKINSNYNNIKNNQKKISSQREEFLLQKIKKLENEIIKQKDLIIKLTYNKRFNIGIRKIRVNSILIKGNDNRLKRKNSINNILLNNLYCNNIYKNNYFYKTLPNKVNNMNNKYIKKNSQKIKTKKEDINLHVRSSYSYISSNPKKLEKKPKNNYYKNKDLNKTMIIYNKENSINLKLDKFDISKNGRNNNNKIKEAKTNATNKNSIEDKKSNEEKNINKVCGDNFNYNYKKIGPHKTCGKTSLIMSVINDNLLGNYNLPQYMNEYPKKNTELNRKLNLKRNSFI